MPDDFDDLDGPHRDVDSPRTLEELDEPPREPDEQMTDFDD